MRDDRFKKGFWFPGNDTYICISFWSGGDSNHKTPNIYFEINERHGCRVIIVAKDSNAKYDYFEKMVEILNEADNVKYAANKKGRIWIKQLSNNFRDWPDALTAFTMADKRRIDEYVDDNKLSDFEEFVSKFGFITAMDFDTMYSRVLKERDSIKEAEYNRHRAFLNKPKLPFALLGINIENFQGIKNTSINELSAGVDKDKRGENTIKICNLNRKDLRLNRLETVYFNFKQKIKLIFDLNALGKLENENVGNALGLVFKEIETESNDETLTHSLLRKFVIASVNNFTNHFSPYLDTQEQRDIAIQAFKNFMSGTP